LPRRYPLLLLALALVTSPSVSLGGSPVGSDSRSAQVSTPRIPVVLVHGFDGGPEDWRGTAEVLEAQGFDPLLLDWGPGSATGAAEVANTVLAPAVEGVLQSAGYVPGDSFHLVGHSLGGLLARVLIEWPGSAVTLAPRVRSLVMISTPNQGARTGLARAACHLYHEPRWRPLACDMVEGSTFLETLGSARPEDVEIPYLSIGAEAAAVLFPAPPYDGDGDGRSAGHDNAVMAEASYLAGAPFVTWRGRRRASHHRVLCSSVVNGWIADFLRDGTVPAPPPGRLASEDSCHGVSKKAWLRARATVGEGR